MQSLASLSAWQEGGELPISLFQLDDGWQSAWGDWLKPNTQRFPNGLKPLADAVRQAGMLPGIWLAPAALVGTSEVATTHQDWILRDNRGKPVNCGFTAPGIWMQALDLTNPQVLSHVRNVIDTIVHKWGFGYLKCDFMHCAAMPGAKYYNPSMPRSAVLDSLMATIRIAAGTDTFVLACGAPLGPCIGHANAIRVSADTAEHWLPVGPNIWGTHWFFKSDQTNLPAARNMVRSTLTRLPMNGVLWVNDPDCLILRPDVPLAEAQALATVASFSAGSLIFSDSIEEIVEERLAMMKALLPPLPHTAQFVDTLSEGIPSMAAIELAPKPAAASIGRWHLVAVFNWTDGNQTMDFEGSLPLTTPSMFRSPSEPFSPQRRSTEWHVFDFWTGMYRRHTESSDAFVVPRVSPRGCRMLAVRPVQHGRAQLVGSDVHISCGLEVKSWSAPSAESSSSGPLSLEMTLDVGRAVPVPRLWVYLPGSTQDYPPKLFSRNGKPAEGRLPPVQIQSEVWRVTLPPTGIGGVTCRIEWHATPVQIAASPQ